MLLLTNMQVTTHCIQTLERTSTPALFLLRAHALAKLSGKVRLCLSELMVRLCAFGEDRQPILWPSLHDHHDLQWGLRLLLLSLRHRQGNIFFFLRYTATF